MTIKELINTLKQRKEGLAYKMWKQANLIGAMFSSEAPENPEDGCPELFPPKKKYIMPDFLVEKAIKRGVM